MSNTNNPNNPANQPPKPGEWHLDPSGRINRSVQEFEMPDGRIARVGVRIGLERDDSIDAEEGRTNYLARVYPPELTRELERQTTRLQEQLNDFTGYDREGKPLFRLQGRPREIAEMQLASKTAALKVAQRDRIYAEQLQAKNRADDARRAQLIETQAQAEAQRLIDQAEIDRRASQIAAKAGVRVGDK